MNDIFPSMMLEVIDSSAKELMSLKGKVAY